MKRVLRLAHGLGNQLNFLAEEQTLLGLVENLLQFFELLMWLVDHGLMPLFKKLFVLQTVLQVADLLSESHFGFDLNWESWYSARCLDHLVDFEVLDVKYVVYHHIVNQTRRATHTIHRRLYFLLLVSRYRLIETSLIKALQVLKIRRYRILRRNYRITSQRPTYIARSRSIFATKRFLIFECFHSHLAISKLALNINADIHFISFAFLFFIDSMDVGIHELLGLVGGRGSLLPFLRAKSLNYIWGSRALVDEVHVGCLGLSDGFGDAVSVGGVVVKFLVEEDGCLVLTEWLFYQVAFGTPV